MEKHRVRQEVGSGNKNKHQSNPNKMQCSLSVFSSDKVKTVLNYSGRRNIAANAKNCRLLL